MLRSQDLITQLDRKHNQKQKRAEKDSEGEETAASLNCEKPQEQSARTFKASKVRKIEAKMTGCLMEIE